MMDKLVSISWWRTIFTRYGQWLFGLMAIVMVIGFGWNQFGGGRNGNMGSSTAPDKVILTVNGEPVTQAQFAPYAGQIRGVKPGGPFASAQGQALQGLIRATVIRQIAKKHNVHATAAEVDQDIDQMRASAGMKKASDSDWENTVQQKTGMTLSELRDEIANSPGLLENALRQSAKTDAKVTDADVTNQNQEAKLDVVLIPYGASRFMPPPKGKIPLTEPQAKAKAEELLGKAKAGGNLAALAKAESGDPSASKGGELEFRPEFKTTEGLGAAFGALGYGKDFDDAVHKTAIGQFTPVVKAGGLSQGYVFAKVVQRRTNTPKDFNPKKALDDLKTAQAATKVNAEIETAVKTAKLDWKDPERKLYYDQNRIPMIQQEIYEAMLSGQTADKPSQDEIAKQQALVDAEWEEQLKRHPDDVNAILMVADAIKTRKRFGKGATPAQNDAYRDQLINLYTTALKTTEDRDLRFDLADLLAEKKDYAKAGEQYDQIAKLMAYDPPYDLRSMQSYQTYYQRLATDYTRIGKVDKAAQYQKEADDLKPKIDQQQAIERAQQQAQQQAQMQSAMPPATASPGQPGNAAATPGTPAKPNGNVTVTPITPGKPGSVTIPSGAPAKPGAPAASTSSGTQR
jgi:hypothetical protein